MLFLPKRLFQLWTCSLSMLTCPGIGLQLASHPAAFISEARPADDEVYLPSLCFFFEIDLFFFLQHNAEDAFLVGDDSSHCADEVSCYFSCVCVCVCVRVIEVVVVVVFVKKAASCFYRIIFCRPRFKAAKSVA